MHVLCCVLHTNLVYMVEHARGVKSENAYMTEHVRGEKSEILRTW
jgi:hypothetical protein